MIRKRRAIAVGVVAIVAAIAACLGPSLSTTQQEAIVVPSTIMLGNVNVGSSSSAMVTIVPASGSQSSMDTITAITKGTCPNWTLDTPGVPGAVVARTCAGSGSEMLPTLHADQSDAEMTFCTDTTYTFTVGYTAVSSGPSSCLITVMTSAGSASNITASATGVAPPYAMEVTPKIITFGDIRVGNTGSGTVYIRNTGANVLDVTLSAPPPYTIGGVNSPIQPNVTQSRQVLCSPGSAGNFDNKLVVNGSGAGTQTVDLQCSGIMTNLDVQPSPVDFTTRVNEPKTIDVTVTAAGAPATFNTITLDPPTTPLTIVTAPPNGSSIGSGSSATVRLRYSPTVKQAFTTLAKLRINHDNNQMRDIVLNGAALVTTLEAFPETVDFGGVCAGTTQQMDVDIKGGTEGGFVLNSTSGPGAPFTFTPKAGTTIPGPVMPNQGNKLEFVASVTPRPVDTMMMGEVTLTTDIPGAMTHKLKLIGEVLPPGVNPSPTRIDFGGVPKGQNSMAAKATVIRNCGDAPVTISSASVVGEFQVVSPDITQPITLEPRGEQEYLVIAHPLSAGVKMGSLVLQTGGAPINVELLVTGVGAGDGGTLGERSYYTCGDCNSGPGAGMFAVLVVLGLRRRRRNK